MPIISIIIPVYNAKKYLKQCIESVLSQTLQDIEIICIDDGSTDNSLELLKLYAQNDPRIVIIEQENQGQSSARNAGLSVAKGEYIGFVDSDDWVDKTMFEKLYQNAKMFKSDIAMCSMATFDERTGTISTKFNHITLDLFPESFENRTFKYDETLDFIFRISACVVYKIYRKDFLKKHNINFPGEFLFAEDNIFSLETFLKAQKCSLLREELYFYRICSDTSTVYGSDFKKLPLFEVHKKCRNVLKQNDLYNKVKKYYETHTKGHLIYWYNQIQDPKVKRQYYLKLITHYPSFLFMNLLQSFKMKIYTRKLKKILKTKKIIFWGASLFLKNFLENFNTDKSNITGIIDKSPSRQGEDFCGYKIMQPESLKKIDFDFVIPAVVNIHNFDKLLKTNLEAMGIKKDVLKLF